MHHRIYTTPFTRINEHWIFNGEFDASPSDSFKDSRISGYIDHFQNNINDLQPQWYEQFAIDIVTETAYNYPHPQITEKTYRPLLNKKMFIIVGACGTLNWLKTKNFKTFSPFINESYDNEKDPVKRMSLILAEINKISNTPLQTIKDIMTEYQPIVEHNFNNFTSIKEKEYSILHKMFND